MDTDKKQIIKSLIRILDHISDKQYQKNAWIKGEAADFDETVCLFFGECDPILEKYKDFEITENQYRLLKKFRDEFEVFSNENDCPEEFIDTPEWEKIIKTSKKVLNEFIYREQFNGN